MDDTVPPNIVSYRHDHRGQWRSEAEGISGFGEILLAAVVLSVLGCVLLHAEWLGNCIHMFMWSLLKQTLAILVVVWGLLYSGTPLKGYPRNKDTPLIRTHFRGLRVSILEGSHVLLENRGIPAHLHCECSVRAIIATPYSPIRVAWAFALLESMSWCD